MEPIAANLRNLQLVSNALVGAIGPEVQGGPNDGALDPFLVVAQLELVVSSDVAEGVARPKVIHLGLTREVALDVAKQLRKAAALLSE